MKSQSWAILGALCLLLIAGCQRGPLEFNNKIAKANKRLAEEGEAFGKAAQAAINGGPSSIADLKQEHQNLLNAITEVKKDMAALSVPTSESAKKLYAAHQKFLAGQEKMINNEFAEIVRVCENKSLSDVAKQSKVLQIVTRVQKVEQADLLPLQAAQREFAKEHNVRLRAE